MGLYELLKASKMCGSDSGGGGEPAPEPVLKNKTITENGTYNASDDNADGYKKVTVKLPYVTPAFFPTMSPCCTSHNEIDNNWVLNGQGTPDGIYGNDIWTDGFNIYCSHYSNHYVLNKSTSTWDTKRWTGLTYFTGTNIWSDGDNIYYSDGNDHYVLNKSTSTWTTKTWTGLTNFYGAQIWTDGDNIYYSSGSTQYVLDKSTSTWITKTWSGLTDFISNYIWTDGYNIYYSQMDKQYYLTINKKIFPKTSLKP